MSSASRLRIPTLSPKQQNRFFVGGAALVVVFMLLWWFTPPSEITAMARGSLKTWSKLRAVQAEQKRRPRYSWVSLDSVPLDVQLAVVMGEDVGFLYHNGIDYGAMREAIDEWLEGDKLRGASTLTQQLAKNLFLSEERSFLRKIREAHYTYWLEHKLGKRRILELYLNVVELDENVFGVEAGAQHYFGMGVGSLGFDEAAELAAAIPSPQKHNPATRTKSWQVRKRAIVERMQRFDNVRARLSTLTRPRADD